MKAPLSHLFACALSLGLLSCDNKKADPANKTKAAVNPTAPAPSAKPPAVKTQPAQDTQSAIDLLDHMNWPVEVKIGKDGKAIPPKTGFRSTKRSIHNLVRSQRSEGNLVSVPSTTPRTPVQTAQSYLVQVNGPYVRQPFKQIHRAPSGGSKAGGSKHQVKSNGERNEFDADSRTFQHWGNDGSSSTWNSVRGEFSYSNPQGETTVADLTNGGKTTYDNEGTVTTHNPNGSVDINNEDGSGAHLYGKDGPDGAIGYTYGPGGPSGERETMYEGGRTETEKSPPGGDGIPDPKDQGGKGNGSADPTRNLGPGQGGGFKDGSGGPGSDPLSSEGQDSGIPAPDDQGGGKTGSADPEKNLGPAEGGGFKDGSGGPASDGMASGTGEPHYVTRDGAEFTTQAAGEFVLVKGVAGREVQVRQQPWAGSSSVSAISAMAFRVNDSKIEVRLDGTVLLDGIAAPDLPMVQGEIPGGGVLGVWRKDAHLAAVVIVWPDLSAAWVLPRRQWLDFHLQWRRSAPEHRGLLGSNDGNPANDLADRNGTLVDGQNEAAVRGFVDSWRVTDAESLFTYGEGQSTATYTLKDFPSAQAPPEHAALAQECCGKLPEGFAKKSCLYDVERTGDRNFADSYKDVAVRRSGALIHQRWGRGRAPKLAAANNTGGLQITEEERKNAQGIELGGTIKETLPAGQSRVYKFEFAPANGAKLGVLSNELEVKKPYTPEIAGYALFDSEGKRIGSATAAVNDFPATDLKAGSYFIKIVGPGLIHIKLH